jgi:hypothetical protein
LRPSRICAARCPTRFWRACCNSSGQCPRGATIALADLTIGVQAVLDEATPVTATAKHLERIPGIRLATY